MTLLWTPANIPQPLESGCVHVWAWDFACDPELLARATSILSADEMRRMKRFHFERHQVRYAICHGNLRRILGSYLQLPPSQLQFEENRYGKPKLVGQRSGQQIDPGLNFNLSHTTDVALLAMGRDIDIGVDVEQIRPIETEIAANYFSSRELVELAVLSGQKWLEGFYNCWTRKEAILKAEGVGLNVRLDAFDVSLTPGAPAQLLEHRAEAGLHTNWVLEALTPAEDAAGALATNYIPTRISCWQFADSIDQ